MAATAKTIVPVADLQSFTEYLGGCKRVLALLGAGISASSGLPTFRGAGGLWRSYDATSLATPEAFGQNPGLVWQFYNYRRHMALQSEPNKAHYALAELARRNEDFITLSQNVDGMLSYNELPCSYTLTAIFELKGFLSEQIIHLSNCTCFTEHSLTSNAPTSIVTTRGSMIIRIQSFQPLIYQGS